MFSVSVQSNPAGALTVTLAGSVDAGALPGIERLIEDGKRSQKQVVLDLEEVTLMDRAAVLFVAGQLKQGVEVTNCPVYINHWILRETTHEHEK